MSTLLSRAKEVKSAEKCENIDIASKISRHRQKQYHIEPHNEQQPPPIFDDTVSGNSRFPQKKANPNTSSPHALQQNVMDGKSNGPSPRNSIETIALVNTEPQKPPAYSELQELPAPSKHSVDLVKPPYSESEALLDVNPCKKEVKAASVLAPSGEQVKSNTATVVDAVVEQLPAKHVINNEETQPLKSKEPSTFKKEDSPPMKNALQPPSGEKGKTHFGLGKLWKKSGSQKSTKSSDSAQQKIPEPVQLLEKQPEKVQLTNATEKANRFTNKQKQKVTNHKRTLASTPKPLVQTPANLDYEDTFMIFNFYEVLQPPPMFTNFKDGFMHFMRTAVQHPQFVEGYLLKDGTSKGKFPYFHYAEFDINGRTFQHDPKWVRAIIEGYGNLQVHHQAGFSYQFSYKSEIPNWSLKDIPNIKERAACLVTVFKAEGNFDRLDSTWQKWSGADFINHHLPRDAMVGKMVLYKRCVPHGTFTYVFVCELVNGLKFYNALLELVERLNERSCGYSSLYFIDEMF